jgi:NAD+ kinase
MAGDDGRAIARIGVMVHPKREVQRPLDALRDWAQEHDVEVVQIGAKPNGPQVAPDGEAGDVGLVVAIGGDGTVLAALRAAAPCDRPVLGVACGSVGALTTVAGTAVAGTLDAFASGDWHGDPIPAVHVGDGAGGEAFAFNDVVIVRDGGNQVSCEVEADGALYARFSGDGVIGSTQLGSSAYALAAGGPLLAPGSDAWLVTPLAAHAGFIPPLVLGARSHARLYIEPGYAGARAEVDGQPAELELRELELDLRQDHGTVVRVGDDESFLTSLRRRGIVTDSPRMLAREARLAHARPAS